MDARKKLYECRYEVVYYALAESAREAASCLSQAVSDETFDMEGVLATEVAHRDTFLEGGWEEGCLVYQPLPVTRDYTLREALAPLPTGNVVVRKRNPSNG